LKRKHISLVLALLVLALLAASIWVWQRNGAYGFNVLMRRAGTYWNKMGADFASLPPSMREALKDTVPPVPAGQFYWREFELGFEVTEMPVMLPGEEVDRILLNRIDPKRFRFVMRSAPEGDRGLDEWERALPSAVPIVNGSYFGLKGKPGTLRWRSTWTADQSLARACACMASSASSTPSGRRRSGRTR